MDENSHEGPSSEGESDIVLILKFFCTVGQKIDFLRFFWQKRSQLNFFTDWDENLYKGPSSDGESEFVTILHSGSENRFFCRYFFVNYSIKLKKESVVLHIMLILRYQMIVYEYRKLLKQKSQNYLRWP